MLIPGDAMERFVNPQFCLTFDREAVDALEAATRSALGQEAAAAVGGGAPERSGSENRHDAVRESGSQYVHAHMGASE